MPSLALKIKNKLKRRNFKSEKNLKFCADSKRWNFSDFPVRKQNCDDSEITLYRVPIAHCEGIWENFWLLFKSRFCNFTIKFIGSCKKKSVLENKVL